MQMSDRMTENERGYVYAELGATMRHAGVVQCGVYPNESITAGERNPRLAITTDNTKCCRMHPVYMDL